MLSERISVLCNIPDNTYNSLTTAYCFCYDSVCDISAASDHESAIRDGEISEGLLLEM